MGVVSGITWTDSTFNPWIGCQKVSPACRLCYAEVSSPTRVSRKQGLELWGPASGGAVRRVISEEGWKQPEKWNRQARQKQQYSKVFCASLADVFEDYSGPVVDHNGMIMYAKLDRSYWTNHPELDTQPLTMDRMRRRLFALIERTPWLVWMLLTKRPENIQRMMPDRLMRQENVWLGTTVENQECADERIPILQAIPGGNVRWLSVEPLLGPVDLDRYIFDLDWVIVGGESGNDAKPMQQDWARDCRLQCVNHGVPFFFKQWGEWAPPDQVPPGTEITISHKAHNAGGHIYLKLGKDNTGDLLDGRQWHMFPEYPPLPVDTAELKA